MRQIVIIVFLFCMFSCKKQRKTEKIYLEINVEDTLNLKTEFGNLKFHHILDDTLKISNKDDRVLFIYIGLFDKEKKISEIRKIECDTFFNKTKNFKDTISTPFYIQPKNVGEKMLAGFVEEMLFLKMYKYKDTNMIRQIIKKHYFKKDVYISNGTGRKSSKNPTRPRMR